MPGAGTDGSGAAGGGIAFQSWISWGVAGIFDQRTSVGTSSDRSLTSASTCSLSVLVSGSRHRASESVAAAHFTYRAEVPELMPAWRDFRRNARIIASSTGSELSRIRSRALNVRPASADRRDSPDGNAPDCPRK